MLEYLPQELRDGFEAARRRSGQNRKRLRVQLGEAVYPIRRFWDGGFALDAALSPGSLRGLVDVHDGALHIFQCLIVAASVEDGELVCEFKRLTPISDGPALDYWRDETRPIALLPRR